jgi:hypothetical protein
MARIWDLKNKFEIWKEIEVLACEAQAELGQAGITAEEAARIRATAANQVERIDEIERVTNHDVIAFLTNMAEHIDAGLSEDDPKPSRWVHYGMTSSDLGETALCYQMTQAMDIVIARPPAGRGLQAPGARGARQRRRGRDQRRLGQVRRLSFGRAVRSVSEPRGMISSLASLGGRGRALAHSVDKPLLLRRAKPTSDPGAVLRGQSRLPGTE